jgi:tetratricopeptide (TPR) repeat protein
MLLAHYGAPVAGEWLEQCESALDRALTLEPDLAIALSARGGILFFFRRDLAGAAADLQRALMLLPSYSFAMLSLANVCAVRHAFDEANGWLDQALLVDPLDVGVNMNVGDHRILQRRYAEAATALGAALEIVPRHRPCQLRLGWALSLAGDAGAARALLDSIGPEGDLDSQWHEYAALAGAASGDSAMAAYHHQALCDIARRQHVPDWSLARAAAAADSAEEAMAHLVAAAESRSSSVPFLMVTPAFDGLHADPRFRALGTRLGLPEPPDSVAASAIHRVTR